MVQRLQQLAALFAACALLLLLWIAFSPGKDPAAHDRAGPVPATAQPSPLPQASLPPGFAATAVMSGDIERGGTLLFKCRAALCIVSTTGEQLTTIEPQPGGEYLAPRWSPDGNVFAALYLPHGARSHSEGETRGSGSATAGELIVFSAAGEPIASLIPQKPSMQDRSALLVWSPDGQRLVLSARPDRNGDHLLDQAAQMWVLEFSSAEKALSQLDSFQGGVPGPPLWSPDGRMLAYVRHGVTGGDSEIWVYDVEARQARLAAVGSDPAWIPGTNRLAFVAVGGAELRTVDRSGKREHTLLTIQKIADFLTLDDPSLPQARLSFARPTWSPDGSRLAFRVWGQPVERGSSYIPGMLFTSAADGNDLRRWPDTDTANTSPQLWSPAGDHLIYPYWLIGQDRFTPGRTTPEPGERFTYPCAAGLILVDLKRNSYREEACGSIGIDLQSYGAWSPSGRAFATRSGSAIVLFSVDFPPQRRIFAAPQPREIQWRPDPLMQ
ncbi:MAG: hypothetical protein KatS3mg057_0659 [Herpetosiphonaceae bacterium]|nr:MAG: hypothetical protein KatS3mg057_0659 [Herpetosiphonaceae bacterium]